MKRERKDSVWVYNIFSTRSSFFYNKYYELILSSWIWWDKKFDFPCGVFKKYQRKWDFSTQSMIKGESKRNKVSTVWRRGRSGSTWSQWRSSNDFSFWIQFNCVRSIQACPTITSRSWERGKKPFPCKNCLSQVKNAAVELFLKVRRLKAKKMGQNSMKGRVNIQKKKQALPKGLVLFRCSSVLLVINSTAGLKNCAANPFRWPIAENWSSNYILRGKGTPKRCIIPDFNNIIW